MAVEIKDEWVEAAMKAYKRIDAFVDDDALRRAIEAIAPAIYEAGVRAGLAEMPRLLLRCAPDTNSEWAKGYCKAVADAMALADSVNPPEPAGDDEAGGDDQGHGELRD